MNIVDTNGVIRILKDNLNLSRDYYLAPDVVEESSLAEIVHNRRMPNGINRLSASGYLNQDLYLDHYKRILNKYGGRSFYNMTGFGDVSILAAIHVIFDIFEQQRQGRLFDISEQIVVFTDDADLTTKINTEFTGKNIVVRSVADIS